MRRKSYQFAGRHSSTILAASVNATWIMLAAEKFEENARPTGDLMAWNQALIGGDCRTIAEQKGERQEPAFCEPGSCPKRREKIVGV